ncbi:hypothetical protein N7465_007271 [Penicillium sp. CMV-2018d]|nr:hypothetical protein N7465_007271 [Penicillium sp. CMV-2018d]
MLCTGTPGTMASSISSLPPELWSQIRENLTFKDICAMRLSCRAMNIGTCHYFAHEIFHELYLTLTSEGLRELEYVAHHEIFSQHVKRLWIVPSLCSAQYTWTLDDIKRQIQVQKYLQQSNLEFEPVRREQFLRHRGGPVGAMDVSKSTLRRATRTPDLALLLELPAEDQYAIYRGAVLDHFRVILSSAEDTSAEKTRLQDALESCLPLLSNLRTVGLRHFKEHRDNDSTRRFPRTMMGISTLKSQLGFNPVYPPGLKDDDHRSSFTRGSLFQSYILSTLLAALGRTRNRIATLETCGGMMVDDGISLTPSEEKTLIPVLQELQHLCVCILSAYTQDSERQSLDKAEEELAFLLQQSAFWKERKNHPALKKNRLLPLLAKTAPEIQSLDLTMLPAHNMFYSPPLEQDFDPRLADAHFDWISQHFKCSRLSTLTLRHIIVTVTCFKELLKTALPTLKHLTLDCLTWTSDIKIQRPQTSDFQDEGVRICRGAFVYLRDYSRIQNLSIGRMCYRHQPMTVLSEFHPPRPRGPPPLRGAIPYWKRYDINKDTVSLEKWIDGLVIT